MTKYPQQKRLADADVPKVTSIGAADYLFLEQDGATKAITGDDFNSSINGLSQFDSVSDMVAAGGLTIGQYVQTLGYERPGDGGAATYEIVAAATGTDDGGSYIDLATYQAKLCHSRAINAAWWGVVLDASGAAQEKGAEMQAAVYYAFDLAASRRQDTEPHVFFHCPNDYLTKNTIHWTKSGGARAAFLYIDHRVKVELNVTAWDAGDGTLSTHHDNAPIPIFNWRFQASVSNWGEIDCKHRAAGIRVYANSAHYAYGVELYSFRRYGRLVLNASNGDFTPVDWNIKQWLLNDTDDYPLTSGGSLATGGADNQDNYDGDCAVHCYKDHKILRGRYGWAKSGILLLDQTGRWGNVEGKDIYWDGLVEAGNPFYHADNRVTSNGTGDVHVIGVHIMQGYGAVSAQPRTDNLDDGGPAGLVSYNTTNEALVLDCDIDACTIQLYGDSIRFHNCSYISGGTNQQSDRVVVVDPRVRVYRTSQGSNFGSFILEGIKGATIGFYDSVEGTVSGDYEAWNAANQPGGDVYSGEHTWSGFWDASGGNGTCPTTGVTAGHIHVVSAAGTVDGETFAEGDYLIARVNSPGATYNSTNWLHTTYGDVQARNGSYMSESINPRYKVIPKNATGERHERWYRPGGDFGAEYDSAGTAYAWDFIGATGIFKESIRSRVDPSYPDYYTANETPGTTDMRSAIIAAGDYVNANGGGRVNFLPQVYAVSDECLFDDYIGVEFIGCGTRSSTTSAGTEIKLADGANKTLFKFTHSTATEKSRIKVKGIGFNGNRSNQTYATCYAADTGHAIHVSDVDNVEVSGCFTRGLCGHSVYFSDGPCNDSKVLNNFFYDSGRTAIKGPTLADSELYDNEIAGAGKFAYDEAADINDGIAIGSDGNTIRGGAIWQVVGIGVDILGERNHVSGMRIDGCTRALIQVDKAGNNIIGNNLFGAGVTTSSRDASPTAHFKSAIRVKDSASDTLIVGNHCSPFKKVHGNEGYSGAQNYGIYDEGATTKITANKCSGNYLDGIYAGGAYGTVRDNDCLANRQKGIRITGTSLRVEQNNCFLNEDGIHNTGTGSVIRGNDVSEVASGFSSTLSADMGSGDSTISVASVSGLTIGDPIVVTTDNGLFYLNWVENIVSTTITLRHPINGGSTVATSGNAVVNARQAYGVYLGNAAVWVLADNVFGGNATADIFDNNGAAHTGSLADLVDLNRDSNSREVTIASGAITVRRGVVYVDTESDGATDDLATITAPGAVIGDRLVLRAQNGARTVVVKNGTGNIYLQSGADYSLDDTNKGIALNYTGTGWIG